MARDVTLPDPGVVLELVEGFRRSKVLFCASALGVFDALHEGPRNAGQLAGQLGCHTDALERLLDACVGLQLLIREGPLYANTPAAQAYLCRSSPTRVTGYVHYSNAVLWKLWANLEDAVRQGTHRWHQTFGWQGPIFENFFHTEDLKREFLMGMHGYGVLSSPEVVGAFDLSRFRRLVDLGAATGHLAMAACSRWPQISAVIFDLPEALDLARDMAAAHPARERLHIVAGDFFTDPLPPGDLYALGRILHDWSDDKARKLLRRVYAALPPGGGVLIAEKLLADDKRGPRWAHLQSLNMLVCTEGKERTLAEYAALLEEAGFRDVAGCRTRSPLDAVLATRP